MKQIVFFIFFFCSVQMFSQKEKNKGDYNLPPGAILKHKALFYDLSYKIEHKTNEISYTDSDIQVIKNFSSVDLETLEKDHPQYYKYYSEGLSFINSLSSKVKSIYSTNELWYIYAFDQKLKNKLTTIK